MWVYGIMPQNTFGSLKGQLVRVFFLLWHVSLRDETQATCLAANILIREPSLWLYLWYEIKVRVRISSHCYKEHKVSSLV